MRQNMSDQYEGFIQTKVVITLDNSKETTLIVVALAGYCHDPKAMTLSRR